MPSRAITALFDDYGEAAKAVDRIEAEGIPQAAIAVVASNEGERHAGRLGLGAPSVTAAAASQQDPAAESDAADGAGAGASIGTVLGGGAGLLAGLGLIAIPGVGPVVAAGWLVAALTGAGVGAAAGGLLGALTGAGLSRADAETYAEGVRRGGTLVTVQADEGQAERVLHLLKRGGAVDLDERAEGWRAQGWTGGTAGAAANPGARREASPETAPAASPGTASPNPAAPAPRPATEEIGSTAIGAAASTTTGLDTGRDLPSADPRPDTLAAEEPRPSPDPHAAPPTRVPPGGIG